MDTQGVLQTLDDFFKQQSGPYEQVFVNVRDWQPTSGSACRKVLRRLLYQMTRYRFEGERGRTVLRVGSWAVLDCYRKLVQLVTDQLIVEESIIVLHTCCRVPEMRAVDSSRDNYDVMLMLLDCVGSALVRVTPAALVQRGTDLIENILTLLIVVSRGGTQFSPDFTCDVGAGALLNFVDVLHMVTKNNVDEATVALMDSDFTSVLDALMQAVSPREVLGEGATERLLEMVWWCVVYRKQPITSRHIEALDTQAFRQYSRILDVAQDLRWAHSQLAA